MQCTTYNGYNGIPSTVTRLMCVCVCNTHCVWHGIAYVSITCNGVCVLGFGTCVDNLIKIRQCWFDTIYFDSIVDTHIMWIEQCSMSTNKSLSHWWTEKPKINVDVKNLSMNLWKNLSNNYSKKKLFKALYQLWIPHNPNVDSSDMQFSFPFIFFKWKRKKILLRSDNIHWIIHNSKILFIVSMSFWKLCAI